MEVGGRKLKSVEQWLGTRAADCGSPGRLAPGTDVGDWRVAALHGRRNARRRALKIAKGLPLYGKGANPDATGSLKEDYTYAFRRKDKAPYVAFAADGRYLPPGGKRAIEIESMNVSNILTVDARDDRMLVFSKKFHLEKGEHAVFRYPVRAVSSGEYVLPGPSVEAMYFPDLRSKCAPRRIRVGKEGLHKR